MPQITKISFTGVEDYVDVSFNTAFATDNVQAGVIVTSGTAPIRISLTTRTLSSVRVEPSTRFTGTVVLTHGAGSDARIIDYSRLNGLKIMFLGDSNTLGNPNTDGGYRTWIWLNHFNLLGLTPNFVGLQDNGPGPPNLPNGHNEGRSGYEIGPLGSLNLVPDLIPLIYSYNQPDLILLMIGTNDAGNGRDCTTAGARLGNLLDITRNTLPSVRVVVAKIPPQGITANNDRVNLINSQIPGVVAARSSWCFMVDNNTGFSLATDVQGDGVHLTVPGYKKAADNFFGGINQYLLTFA